MRRVTTKHLKRWFDYYNATYFKGRLEPPWALRFRVLKGRIGETTFLDLGHGTVAAEVAISTRLRFCMGLCQLVLLHEMAHLAHPHAVYGQKFQRELIRLISLGAYEGLL